jgi:GT2 family glycosyltransferase
MDDGGIGRSSENHEIMHHLTAPVPEFNHTWLPDGVSVVIPNYNGLDLFPKTIPPLLEALNHISVPSEIIVADDASTDDSVIFLQNHYPQIRIIRITQNGGFSKTINKGISAARYQLILLLNSDIILTPTYLTYQFKYFSDKRTFGVQGRIVGWNDDFIQDAARYPAFHGCKLKTSVQYLTEPMDDKPLFTLYLSGACALVDRDKLRDLGGFNEIFSPFYAEDLELSMRAWRRGWYCYYEHNAICRHRTSSTIQSKEKKKYVEKIYYRNKMYFHGIHLPLPCLVVFIIQTVLEALFRALMFRFTLLQAFHQFIRNSKLWWHARRMLLKPDKMQEEKLNSLQVVRLIKKSLQGSRLIFFRPGQRS